MATPIIDLPPALSRAVSLSWTMETNHGLAASAFSGHVQAQRGHIERWAFTMRLKKMNRPDAQTAIGFFLQLESNLNLFRMADPAACKPLGRATGSPTLAAPAAARDRTLSTTGWAPNIPNLLKAGDWIQLGHQLSRIVSDVSSSPTGTATLQIFPRLYLPLDTGTPIITHHPKGLFRFTSDLPAFDISTETPTTPYTFNLTGTQEILTPELFT